MIIFSGKASMSGGKGTFRPGMPGDEGSVAYHGTNNVDMSGIFSYDPPPTGEMVMVCSIFEHVYTCKRFVFQKT